MSNDNTPPSITGMREHLMATLASLRDRDNPMDVDRARAVAQVAGVLVDTARVEVEYLKQVGDGSRFLDSSATAGDTPRITSTPTGIVHRLQG